MISKYSYILSKYELSVNNENDIKHLNKMNQAFVAHLIMDPQIGINLKKR